MAKYLHSYQPWILSRRGNSLFSAICFYLQFWRHGKFLSRVLYFRYFKGVEIFMAQGLWMGIICGLGIQVTALVTMNLCTNWDEGVGPSLSAWVFRPSLHDKPMRRDEENEEAIVLDYGHP